MTCFHNHPINQASSPLFDLNKFTVGSLIMALLIFSSSVSAAVPYKEVINFNWWPWLALIIILSLLFLAIRFISNKNLNVSSKPELEVLQYKKLNRKTQVFVIGYRGDEYILLESAQSCSLTKVNLSEASND